MKKSKYTTINVFIYLGIASIPLVFLCSLILSKIIKINDFFINISYGIISSTLVVFLVDLYNYKKSKVASEEKENIIFEELYRNLKEFKSNISKQGAEVLNNQEIKCDLFGWVRIIFSEDNYDDGFNDNYAENIFYEIVDSISKIQNSLIELKSQKVLLAHANIYSIEFSNFIDSSITKCKRIIRNIESDKISLFLIQNQLKYLMNEIEKNLTIKLEWENVAYNFETSKFDQ